MEAFTGIIFWTLCCCWLFIVFPIGLVYLVLKARILSRTKQNLPTTIEKIWYRSGLFTPRGGGFLLVSSFGIWLATASIELSLLSMIAIFFGFILIGVWLWAQVFNMYLLVRRASDSKGQKLISSYVNYHLLQAGDAIRQTLEVNLSRPWGFILKFRVVVPPRLGQDLRVTGLANAQDKSVTDKTQNNLRASTGGNIELIPQFSKRGEYKLGPIVVEYSDMFGLVKIMIVHEDKDLLKIIPKLRKIRKLAWIAPTKKIGDEFSRKLIINTDEMFDMRKYVHGDDMRRIHWKASAKRLSAGPDIGTDLILRKPELTYITLGDFVVVLDNQMPQRVSNFANTDGSAELLDRMVDVAASILDYAERYKTKTKLFYFNKSGKLKRIDPMVTKHEEWLLELAAISWVNGRTNSFEFKMNDSELKAVGMYLLTAETYLPRLRSIEDSIEAGSTNVVYFPSETYIVGDEKKKGGSWGKRIARLVLAEKNYSHSQPFPEVVRSWFTNRVKKMKQKPYKKLIKASLEAQAYFDGADLGAMFIRKKDNYIRLLETGRQ